MKPIISVSDLEINPTKGVFNKIPFFIDDDSQYKKERAHQNYGVMMAVHLANSRFVSVMEAIKQAIENDDMSKLKQVYEEYK